MEEQSYVTSILKPLSGKINDFWTGLNDLDEEQVFTFTDNEPLLFNFWNSGTPRKDCE